jgi:putative membrane protein
MPDLNERRAVDSVVLALLRTEMANRRTLLAYVKTALGIAVTGLALIRFTEAQSAYAIAGMALLPVSLGVLIVGAIDFIRTRRKIQSEKVDAGV